MLFQSKNANKFVKNIRTDSFRNVQRFVQNDFPGKDQFNRNKNLDTSHADSSHSQKIHFRTANTLFRLMGYVAGAVFKSSWLRIDAIAAPFLTAFRPWQNPCERSEKVENRQRNERRIVGDHRNGGHDLTYANTTKGWIHSPNFDGTFARELS